MLVFLFGKKDFEYIQHMEINRYFRLWWHLAKLTTQVGLQSRFGAIVFLIGKFLRFGFFLLFLVLLVTKTNGIAGYSFWQVLFFFATFNVLDTIPQLLWREVYRFRTYVMRGFFDYIITKPVSPLFRCLFGGSDILDMFVLFISVCFAVYAGLNMGGITLQTTLLYLFLMLNSLLIALSFHIFVLAIGILTTEVDNAIMLYRDLTQMGRVPVDIYQEPIRGFITFIIPVGIMMTFPAKGLMGLLSFWNVAMSGIFSLLFFVLSVFLWRFSLRRYASVSS